MGSAPAHTTADLPLPSPTAEATLSVLVVDDSSIILERIAEMVVAEPRARLAGLAATAAEASLLFLRERPDVVILDIELPDRCGMELLEFFRQTAPDTLFVVVTVHGFGMLVRRCLDLGAAYVLDKASEFPRIREILRSAPRIPRGRRARS